MTAGRNWFENLVMVRNEFQTLGEDRGHSMRRIWFSELGLLYEFLVDIRGDEVYVLRFVDSNHRHE